MKIGEYVLFWSKTDGGKNKSIIIDAAYRKHELTHAMINRMFGVDTHICYAVVHHGANCYSGQGRAYRIGSGGFFKDLISDVLNTLYDIADAIFFNGRDSLGSVIEGIKYAPFRARFYARGVSMFNSIERVISHFTNSIGYFLRDDLYFNQKTLDKFKLYEGNPVKVLNALKKSGK